RLDDDLIHSFLRLLVPAGAGTTYRLLGSLLLALVRDPEQLGAVREDRSLVPAAIEESLRWEAPVQFSAREATRDVQLAGVDDLRLDNRADEPYEVGFAFRSPTAVPVVFKGA